MQRFWKSYKKAYEGLPREVWLLASVTLANRMGTMVMPFFSLYITREMGWSVEFAGYALAVFGVGAVIGSLLIGWLGSLMNLISLQLFTLIGAGLTFFAMPFFDTKGPILIAMALSGFFGEGFRPANSALYSEVCPAKVRPRAFALNRLVINVGMTLGPAVGGFIVLVSYPVLFYIDAASFFVASALLYFFFRNHSGRLEEEPSRGSFMTVLKDSHFVIFMLLTIPVGIIYGQLYSTAPLYLKEHYFFLEPHIGLWMALNTVMVILLEMPLIKRMEGANQLKLIGVGSLLLASGLGLLGVGTSVAIAAFAMIVHTIGEMIAAPTAGAYVATYAPPSKRPIYLGYFSASYSASGIVAPILGMKLYAHNPHWIWYMGLIIGPIVLAGYLLLERHKRVVR